MSVYHLQRYVGLKVLDNAGEDGLKLDPMARPFRAHAKDEFGHLSEKLFRADVFSSFRRIFDTLEHHGDIEKHDDGSFVITDQGRRTLEYVEKEYALPARTIKGVHLSTRQDYLFLKTAAERTHRDVLFVDEMNHRGQDYFGQDGHSVDSELYPWSLSEHKYLKHGFVEWDDNIGEHGDYVITEEGLEHLANLEARVAPAIILRLQSSKQVSTPSPLGDQ